MSQNPALPSRFDLFGILQEKEDWNTTDCVRINRPHNYSHESLRAKTRGNVTYAADWESVVPNLIEKLVTEVADKKKMELRFTFLEMLTKQLKSRVIALESSQTKIIPVNTFAPEPYELLKPFLVCVQTIDDGFEAGWYDANIHSSGENEEEAVSNLKSLILDFFDSLSKEKSEKLGIEPKRQLDVLTTFIKKAA